MSSLHVLYTPYEYKSLVLYVVLVIMTAFLGVLNILDVGLTYVLMSMGGTEENLLMDYVIQNYGFDALLIFKLFFVVMFAILITLGKDKILSNPFTIRWITAACVTMVVFYVGVNTWSIHLLMSVVDMMDFSANAFALLPMSSSHGPVSL